MFFAEINYDADLVQGINRGDAMGVGVVVRGVGTGVFGTVTLVDGAGGLSFWFFGSPVCRICSE